METNLNGAGPLSLLLVSLALLCGLTPHLDDESLANIVRDYHSMSPSTHPTVTPFTQFEMTQHSNGKCYGFAQNITTWKPTIGVEKNVFFVWVGPAPIPDRIIFAIASAAIVYGMEWTVKIVTTQEVPDLLARMKEKLEQTGCGGKGLSKIELITVAAANLARELDWTEKDIQRMEDIFAKGGKDNLVTISDFVRAAMVFKYGDVYLDTDTIVMQKIHRPTIGVRCKGEDTCHFDPEGFKITQAGFPLCPITCIVNGVFAFRKKNELLDHYLSQMPAHIEFDKWGIIGPTLFLKTIYWAQQVRPRLLLNIVAMNTMCLLCVINDNLNECANYTYLSFGRTGGELPEQAIAAYRRSVDKYCTTFSS